MDLQLFLFNDQSVRVILFNGDPWFVANDVLNAIKSSTKVNALKSVVSDGLGEGYVNSTPLESSGGIQETTIIHEAAVTFLVSRSRTETGRAFNRLLHTVILPSIRKTGKYEVIPSQPEIKTSIPVIASRELALETARSVSEIKDLLADTDPRLCQLLVDVAINDAVNSIKAIAPANEAQWMGVAEIAEYFKLPVTPQNRTALGKFVKAACGNIGKQETRICNGRMMPIWCYPFPNSEVEKAVKNFFK
jgi:prophage antirepressor-like protein